MVSRTTPGEGGAVAVPVVHPRRQPRFWLLDFYGTAVGKKAVMAVTGIIGLGFVLVHMLGNLKLYTGEQHLNDYGEYLREIGSPIIPETGTLWILRAILIVAVLVHIHAAVTLTRMNRQARPAGYQGPRRFVAADYASRTMRWTGVLVGLFIVFHLFDLTWGPANPDFNRGEPYHNLVESLSRGWVAAIYVVANLLLGLHLYHGAWSFFQSLGWNNPRFNQWRRYFAVAFAALVVAGNLSIPIAIVSGAVD